MNGCFGCWEQERIALLQYKASTINYTFEYHFTPWDSANKESDCCEWEKVKCDITTGRVIKLALNNTIYWSKESGEGWYFNASLFLPFEELQHLDLSYNSICGWLPNEGFERFSLLSKLKVLYLDGNYFNNSILSSLSGIASLKELHLGDNNLNGEGFDRFSLLSKLEVLHLDVNNFNHSILQSLSGIMSLKELDLSYNNLNGPIHIKEFKAFSNLEELYLSVNKINDFVTTRDSNILTKLQHLDLSLNDFSTRVLKSLTAFPSLKILDLSYNNLMGSFTTKELSKLNNLEQLKLDNSSIDKSLLHKIGVMTSLKVLAVKDCGLSGPLPDLGILPTWIGNISSLEDIFMAKNHLEGPIPIELCKLVQLTFLDLSDNNLFGFVPSCFNSSSIKFFQLNKNFLSGPIPSAFQNNSNLFALNLRDNLLTGSIPNWIGSLSSLRILLLKGNHLGDQIPIQLCFLQHLIILDLSYNKFSGPIPHCLSNITFDASTQDTSFEGLYSRETYSSSLTLYSTIIQALSYDIFIFDPSVNAEEEVEFATKSRTYTYKGYILEYMFGIDLSCNNLEGNIPSELGRISSSIRALNLSHNNLSGPIPVTFSNLKQIESLDLSYNNLNGKIPPQLTEMTSLAVFSVAHNNLSGATPDRKNQFITFDENSYEGNPLLCGPPLQNGCTKIRPPFTIPEDNEGEKGDGLMDMGVFYISFAVIYITVLLGIVAVLYINPYWRKAWFNLIEVCIDTCYCFVVIHYRKLFNFKSA
ncbi:hypothetical protein SO802_009464 [Lithocarpus litseifolius]|uniref:Leucine-rich repeat-containing N-terminal plant-type domain-containing protein n=1 Tax=Lithocarpus litseifolius TaxID=425828 RepID=A0AAW2DC08_9ROSI